MATNDLKIHPSLIMGFGGTGAEILTNLKEDLILKNGSMPDSVVFRLFDTIADWRPGKKVGTHGGAVEETMAKGNEINLDHVTEYLHLTERAGTPPLSELVLNLLLSKETAAKYPHLKDWLHGQWMREVLSSAHLNIAEGACMQRQIGRFAMFNNINQLETSYSNDLVKLSGIAKGRPINVWLIASAAGGTGAGCILDAAFIMRMVQSRLKIKINLSGLIALPSIYENIHYVSKGRSYSLFRELARLQTPMRTIWKASADPASEQINDRVYYDGELQKVAIVPSKLFDYLYYLGRACTTDAQRRDFFTSVSNATGIFLDPVAADNLLEETVNNPGSGASIWASRIYLPSNTLAELFTWQLIDEYIRQATGWEKTGVNTYSYIHGATNDRIDTANDRTSNLMALFVNLKNYIGKDRREKDSFARSLEPRTVVEDMYQFTGSTLANESLTSEDVVNIRLTYFNPYISLEENEEGVHADSIEVKTFSEAKKYERESQIESRERFAKALEQIYTKYTAPGGLRAFRTGSQFLKERLLKILKGKIDRDVQNILAQTGSFRLDPDRGTTLARLNQELSYAGSESGLMGQIEKTIAGFVEILNADTPRMDEQRNQAINELRNYTPGFFSKLMFWSSWVDGAQKSARAACSDHIRWYQTLELLKDMQDVIKQLRAHYAHWAQTVNRYLRSMASELDDSLMKKVNTKNVERLKARMERIAKNETSIISVADQADPNMHGYLDEMRQSCRKQGEKDMVDELIAHSSWNAVREKTAGLELRIAIEEPAKSFAQDNVSELLDYLYSYFHDHCQEVVNGIDIYDYLYYLQKKGVTNDPIRTIAENLVNRAKPLIQTSLTPTCRLVYSNPSNPDKRNLIGSLKSHIQELVAQQAEITTDIGAHTDKNSICLFYNVSPSLDEIMDLKECRNRYTAFQSKPQGDNREEEEELRRAQVYHIFRAELEAWNIERRWIQAQSGTISVKDHIDALIARLLDDPAMMQAFVYSVITGAIERDDEKNWLWHNSQKKESHFLTTFAVHKSSIVQVAIFFVLQKRIPGKTIKITLDEALKSAHDKALERGRKLFDVLSEFQSTQSTLTGRTLDDILNEDFIKQDSLESEEEFLRKKESFRKVFKFYSDPNIRTELTDRM